MIPPYFDSQKLMEMMMKEFFQRKEEDRKWEKKEKPGFSLTSRRTRRQRQADQISHRKRHSLTSLSEYSKHPNFRWTRNPATELNTNSTPNTPDHSSVQQTPADETPQVPESTVLVVCHSSEENQISSHIPKRFLPNSSPSTPRRSHCKRYSRKVLPPHHHRTTHQSRSPS